MSEIKFKRDTAFRKRFFVPDSFAHPAKMDAQLLVWIVERYTKVGETILDPMAGSGTLMLACPMGLNVVLVDLEEKFCLMMRDNWEKVRMQPQLGYEMGECQIVQGDARQLEGLLVDKIVTSPPYAEAKEGSGLNKRENWIKHLEDIHRDPDAISQITWTEHRKSDNPDDIANLPYGNIDSIITSPPYEGSDVSQTHMTSNKRGDPSDPNYRPSWKRKLDEGYAESKRPYREVDAVITSPPYEGTEARDRSNESRWDEEREKKHSGGSVKISKGYQADAVITSPPYENQIHPTHETVENVVATNDPKHLGKYSQPMLVDGYSGSAGNIGNLKSDSYLQAMLLVYKTCHAVLKPTGLMILVTKNFIREKAIVRLDTDTIKLCEQAGFKFVERHYRELPAQSFWRVIYHQKYPEVDQIKHEDVLVFDKR